MTDFVRRSRLTLLIFFVFIHTLVLFSGTMLSQHYSPEVSYANNQIGEDTIETAFIKNPLATGSIQEFLEAILTVVMVLSVPVIIFFLIYAGFLYTTARGNSDQIKQATQAFMYAIIGGVIVLGAMVLVGIIQNLVTAFGAESGSSSDSGTGQPSTQSETPFTDGVFGEGR